MNGLHAALIWCMRGVHGTSSVCSVLYLNLPLGREESGSRTAEVLNSWKTTYRLIWAKGWVHQQSPGSKFLPAPTGYSRRRDKSIGQPLHKWCLRHIRGLRKPLATNDTVWKFEPQDRCFGPGGQIRETFVEYRKRPHACKGTASHFRPASAVSLYLATTERSTQPTT